MEIKAKCKIDYESVKALTRLSIFRRIDPQKCVILWNTLFGILTAAKILEIILFGFDPTLLELLIYTVFLYFFGVFFYFIYPKICYNNLANLKDAENEYVFGDDSITVTTKSSSYNGSSTIDYLLIVKAYETTKYIFMYQTKNQVLIVDKSYVTDEDTEAIRSKLSSVLQKKYVTCKY